MAKPNWEQIRQEWETTNITFKALAEKHGVKLGTLKSRRSREKWSREATRKDATTNTKVATDSKKMQPSKKTKTTSKGQKRRSGNPNPKNQFTKRNRAAVKHGLFAKYLPEETLEIMNKIDEINPLDILWTNIQMQFASIIRAQQIMFVEDKYDHSEFTTKERSDDFGDETNVEVHASWDKQATFMNSLSRSMAELRNMLKQYVEMANYNDDRLLEVKRIQSIIDKNKAEMDKIKKEQEGEAPPQITIVDAWSDDDE